MIADTTASVNIIDQTSDIHCHRTTVYDQVRYSIVHTWQKRTDSCFSKIQDNCCLREHCPLIYHLCRLQYTKWKCAHLCDSQNTWDNWWSQ